MNYVPLQVHTCYSILESINNIPLIMEIAKKNHYPAMAITDKGNMFGVMEFYHECQKNNIKPIIGLELEVEEKTILLYAINKEGYQNLIKLSTINSESKLTKEVLKDYQDNLLLIIPFKYYDQEIFDIYQNHYIGYSTITEKNQIKTSKVYINDISYPQKQDHLYLDYLKMIKDAKVLGEYEFGHYQDKYFKTNEEILNICDPEDIENTIKISELCQLEITYTQGLLPKYDPNINEYDYLKQLCQKGLNRRLNNNIPETYQKRLDYELEVINKMGFCDYFLVVFDYVRYAKQHDILVGPGRGSAAGSLAAYTLGITDIDPIKYDLFFERFLNPERVTMPDIDIDFDSDKIDQVVDYVIEKYGNKKVASIITFNTLAAKQVIRDVGRVLKISLPLIDELCKQVSEKTLKETYQNNTRFQNLIKTNDNLKKLFEIAYHLEGLPRHISIHAAGIVMSSKALDETIPLYKNEDGYYLTGYSMNYLEELGLLKMDFLSLKNLTLISDVINNIKEQEHLNITFSNIKENDPKTLMLFNKVNTEGIFQFESPGMKNFLKKLKLTTFEELYAAIALFRPGPMDNIDSYIRRKNKQEKIEYLVDDLKPILESTNGIIVYQEQIMQIASLMADYTLGEADILRRAMSKKKESVLINEKDKFIKQAMHKGYDQETSTKVYELILKFANYGFNKSHSVAYAMIAYKMAFLKTYFFKYYMASLLTNVIGSESKTKIYLLEVKQQKENIILPNINISTNKYQVYNNSIICPLSIIKNIGVAICNEIIKEREKQPFTDFIDFVVRMLNKNINQKTITTLILAGCFDEFNLTRRTLIENLDIVLNYAELVQDVSLLTIEKPELINYPEYSKEELVENEQQLFGFYLTNHPVTNFRKNEITTNEIEDNYNQFIEIILLVERTKEVVTKKNEVMLFVDACDEYNSISLTLFPETYQKFHNINKNNIIKVLGRVQKRFDKYQILVSKVEILN